MQIGRHEAGTNALNGMWPRLSARNDRRQGRLDREDFQVRPCRLEHLCAASDMATGADPGDHGVEPVGEVGKNLLRGRAYMNVDVRRVFELLRHPCARGRFDQLDGALDRALHPLFSRRQIECGAVSEHQSAALEAHALRHDKHQPIALHGGNHGKPDAGIARCRLDDHATRLECARTLSVFDHGKSNAVLDRPARITALRLYPDFCFAKQPAHADMGGIANGFEDVGGFHAGFSCITALLRAVSGGSNVRAWRSSGKI